MSGDNLPEARTLDCACIVYRAARRRWIQQVEAAEVILPDAFMLRPQENSLSVCPADSVSPGECAAKLSNCERVLSLHVGRVCSVGLQVVADAEDHAQIRGLPHQSDNPVEAARLAGLLAAQARIIRVT